MAFTHYKLFTLVIVFFITFVFASSIPTQSPRNTSSKVSFQCPADHQHQPFIWRVTNRAVPAYFFGSIHVPSERVFSQLPSQLISFLLSSDYAFFELDLLDTDTVAAISRCQLLPGGETLINVLPPSLYARLQRHFNYVRYMLNAWMGDMLRKNGISEDRMYWSLAGRWQRKRPVWALMLLNQMSECDLRSRKQPILDLELLQLARKVHIRTAALELPQEQCEPLNTMAHADVLSALEQTLSDHERMRNESRCSNGETEELIERYKCNQLDESIFQKSGEGQNFMKPEMIHDLLHKRNVRMARRAAQLLQLNPNSTFFFTLGAAHMTGEGSIIEQLALNGVQVSQVKSMSSFTREEQRKIASILATSDLSPSLPLPFPVMPKDLQRGHNNQMKKKKVNSLLDFLNNLNSS